MASWASFWLPKTYCFSFWNALHLFSRQKCHAKFCAVARSFTFTPQLLSLRNVVQDSCSFFFFSILTWGEFFYRNPFAHVWAGSYAVPSLTKTVWERIQKNSHFETASYSFQSKMWKRCRNAFPTRSRPTTPLAVPVYLTFLYTRVC